MAFPLPCISPAPNPCKPLRTVTWVRSWAATIPTAPTVMMIVPMKNTRGWPNRSPSLAPRNTVLPSTSRLAMTIQAASSTL